LATAFERRPGFNCSTNTHRLAELQRGKKSRIFGLATFSPISNFSGLCSLAAIYSWYQFNSATAFQCRPGFNCSINTYQSVEHQRGTSFTQGLILR
jgi:hypothetical protein